MRKKNTRPSAAEVHTLLSRVTTFVLLGVILVFVVLALIHRDEITVESIVNFSPQNLWLAFLVFMGLYALKSITTVIYVKIIYIAAGIVFPLPVAFLVNILGTAVHLAIPYYIGRFGGRDMAESVLKKHPKLHRLTLLRQRSNFWFAMFSRAIGVIPADPVSIYFGACGMPFRDFLLGSSAGLFPAMIVTTIVGTEINTPGAPGFIISSILFFVMQLGCAVAFYLWIRNNNAAIKAEEKEREPHESSE